MRSLLYLGTGVFLTCVPLFGLQVQAENDVGESGKSEPPQLLEFSVLPVFRAGQYSAEIDAGVLNVGTNYRIRVSIRNPSNEDMAFRGIKPGCACFDVKASSMLLQANKAITLDFTAPVPKKMAIPNASWQIRMEPDTESDFGGIGVIVRYEVAGLLSFLDKRVVLESSLRDDMAEFHLPLILTKPVEVANLLVNLPESFQGIEATVLTKDEKHFLNLKVPHELLKAKYVSGEISCMDSTTGIEDVVYCVIKGESPAAIYPGILRGRVTESGSAVISAMVRLAITINRDATGKDSSTSMGAIIDATFDNKPLQLDLTKISESTFRVSVKLPTSVVDAMKKSKRPEINWTIRTKEETCELRSTISFSE